MNGSSTEISIAARLQSKGSQDQTEEAGTRGTQLDVGGGTSGLDSARGGGGGRAAGAAGALVGCGKRRVSENDLSINVSKVIRTARAGRASLGGRAAGGSGARGARGAGVGGSGSTASGREEVRAVALLFTVGELLGVGGRARALGAGSDTAVGVVGLVVARAGDVVALSNAADVVRVAYGQGASDIAIGYGGIEAGSGESLTLLGALSLGAKGDGWSHRGGGGVRGS